MGGPPIGLIACFSPQPPLNGAGDHDRPSSGAARGRRVRCLGGADHRVRDRHRSRPARTPASPAPSSRTSSSRTPASRTPAPAPLLHYPAQISHGPRDRPRVALTFHGSGDPATAARAARRGREARRPGHRARRRHLARRATRTSPAAILDGGHDLGNHTQRHLDINAMPEAEADAEITGLRRAAASGSPGPSAPGSGPRAAPAPPRSSNGSPARPATRTSSPTTSTPSTSPRRAPPPSCATSWPTSAPDRS